MKFTNLFFFLYLICSISFVQQKKIKQEQPIQQKSQQELRKEKIMGSNIYLGISGRVQEFTVGSHSLIGEETSALEDPVYTYDYMVKPGDRVTITIKDGHEVKGMAVSFKYLDASNNTMYYTSNDVDWTCNDRKAKTTGTIGLNKKWGDYIGYLFGLPAIWSPTNEEYSTCSVQIPFYQKKEWPLPEVKREILEENIKIHSDQIKSVKVGDNELVLASNFEQGPVSKITYDIHEGDKIKIELTSKEGKVPGFAASIKYHEFDGSEQLITTGENWFCDGEPARLVQNIGDTKDFPVFDEDFRGLPVIWGREGVSETVCEIQIPVTEKPIEFQTNENRVKELMGDEEYHENNAIFTVDDTLMELKINDINLIDRVVPENKIKKAYIPIKEGDVLTVKINNQFGGYKGFAGVFKYNNNDGQAEILKTDDVNWECDGFKPKIIEVIGEGTFFNDLAETELKGVKSIWGRKMLRETTCKAKIGFTKGGILFGVDSDIKTLEVNGKELDILDEMKYKDYSEVKEIKTNLLYGDKISFTFPKSKTTLWATKIVAYLDGIPKVFYSHELEWNCGIKYEIKKQGVIGEGTEYDKHWTPLNGANLLNITTNGDKEIKCETNLVDRISNIYIGATGDIKEIKLNDNALDLELIDGMENPTKVKRLNARIKDGDILSITVSKKKSPITTYEFMAARVMLTLGGSKYRKLDTDDYYWDCTGTKNPYTFNKVELGKDFSNWQELLLGATKIYGLQTEEEVTCYTKISLQEAKIKVAATDGLEQFYVDDKEIGEISELFKENGKKEVQEFNYFLDMGNTIGFKAKMKSKKSAIAAKIIVPIRGEILSVETNPEDWTCNEEEPDAKGIVSASSSNYYKWDEELRGVEAIGVQKKKLSRYLYCTTKLELVKSKIAFSAKDKVAAILVNNKTLDLSDLVLDDFTQVKYKEVLLNKGDEVKIIAEKSPDSWGAMIAAIYYKFDTDKQKKIVTDDTWICGCCYKPQIIENEEITKYWEPNFFGAKAIWETEPEIDHDNLGCRTTIG